VVTFYDGAVMMGTGGTASGVATFTTSSLSVKSHTIKGTYAGDATFKSSKGTVTQVVNKSQ
jgi:large repetitive protein